MQKNIDLKYLKNFNALLVEIQIIYLVKAEWGFVDPFLIEGTIL